MTKKGTVLDQNARYDGIMNTRVNPQYGIKNNSMKLVELLTALLLDGSPAANKNVWIGVKRKVTQKNFHP